MAGNVNNLRWRVKKVVLDTFLAKEGKLEEARAYQAERQQFFLSQGMNPNSAAGQAWLNMHDRYAPELAAKYPEFRKAQERTRQAMAMGPRKRDGKASKKDQLLRLNPDPSIFKAKIASRDANCQWVTDVIALDVEDIDFTQCPSVAAYRMLLNWIDRPDAWLEKVCKFLVETKADKEEKRRRKENTEILEALEADRRAFLEQRKREVALVG